MPNTPHVRPNRRLWLAKIAIIREKHVGEEEETQGKVYHRTITVIQEGQMSGGDSGTGGSGGGTGNGDSKCSICNGTGRCTGTYCYKGLVLVAVEPAWELWAKSAIIATTENAALVAEQGNASIAAAAVKYNP